MCMQLFYHNHKYILVCLPCIYVQPFQEYKETTIIFYVFFLWNMDSPLSAILNSYTQHALLQCVAGSIDGIDFFTIHLLCISWHNCIWIAGPVEHFQIKWRLSLLVCSGCNLPPYYNLNLKWTKRLPKVGPKWVNREPKIGHKWTKSGLKVD